MNDAPKVEVIDLDGRRKKVFPVATMTMPPAQPLPKGPFTVTISDENGKMFEVIFPDYTGDLPEDAAVLGTIGCYELLANLLSGAMRVFLGAR